MNRDGDRLGLHGVAACFVAATGISAASAILLGPQTAGIYVFVLGGAFIAISVVLDHVRPFSFEDEEVER